MHIIAERLKELREARNLSQRAFAKQLGVPQPSYSRYETSDDDRFVYPGSNIVIRICKVFDCKAGWLLGLEGAESAPLPTLRSSGPPREIHTGAINGGVNVFGDGNTISPPPINIYITVNINTVNINGQEEEGEGMSEEKPLNESRKTVPSGKVALANSRNTKPTHSDGDLSACKRHTVAVHPNHSGAGSKDSSGKKAEK